MLSGPLLRLSWNFAQCDAAHPSLLRLEAYFLFRSVDSEVAKCKNSLGSSVPQASRENILDASRSAQWGTMENVGVPRIWPVMLEWRWFSDQHSKFRLRSHRIPCEATSTFTRCDHQYKPNHSWPPHSAWEQQASRPETVLSPISPIKISINATPV